MSKRGVCASWFPVSIITYDPGNRQSSTMCATRVAPAPITPGVDGSNVVLSGDSDSCGLDEMVQILSSAAVRKSLLGPQNLYMQPSCWWSTVGGWWSVVDWTVVRSDRVIPGTVVPSLSGPPHSYFSLNFNRKVLSSERLGELTYCPTTNTGRVAPLSDSIRTIEVSPQPVCQMGKMRTTMVSYRQCVLETRGRMSKTALRSDAAPVYYSVTGVCRPLYHRIQMCDL